MGTWAIGNNLAGYQTTLSEAMLKYKYSFQFNEDFSAANISFPAPGVTFSMHLQTTPEAGACPPAEGASAEDKAKCATWVRTSSGVLAELTGNSGISYYIYRIVDENGNRIQPYYDAYVEYMTSTCKPPSTFLYTMLGLKLGANHTKCPTTFLGLPNTGSMGELKSFETQLDDVASLQVRD